MLIGLCAKKRSGKDVMADYLIENYGFNKYSLAAPLKKAVCIIFNWDYDTVEKNENKEKIDPLYGISYRQACQSIGTNWGQLSLCENYPLFKEITGRKLWVKNFIQYYINNKDKNIVIADVRFPHEADAIKALGGKIIKIQRSSLENNDTHESEQYIDTIKGDIIENNSTLDDFYKTIDNYMKELKSKNNKYPLLFKSFDKKL